MTPLILSWSGGKDSMLALDVLLAEGEYKVTGLLTTLNRAHGRISMHGVREALLDAQAGALGLPLRKVYLPEKASNEDYAAAMGTALAAIRGDGIDCVAFGDIFLADIRAYREAQMATANMRALFPLWGQPTAVLAQTFIARGFHAILTCVDTDAISSDFAGRTYDRQLLDDLPPGCDPCGENGEFHTFVYDGPLLRAPLAVATGEHVLRDARFNFCDLIVS
ncbi:MAG TPA: ATP-binding protein [Gammaproteobacteria bacterium]|nr:ATP-binding protein [Gammaproteobacteria bacterium]